MTFSKDIPEDKKPNPTKWVYSLKTDG